MPETISGYCVAGKQALNGDRDRVDSAILRESVYCCLRALELVVKELKEIRELLGDN